jgi:murein DD-endopeptidase MepM/ murein hydrolase activator NlpD
VKNWERARRTALLILFATTATTVAAESGLPQIAILSNSDPLFVQQQADVAEFYRRTSAGSATPPLVLFSYEVRENDSLLALAARFSIPYSALATINRLPGNSLEGRNRLVVPNAPGIFLPLEPQSDLEYVMNDLRRDQAATIVMVPHNGELVPFRFFPGDDFLPDERRSFLGLLFRHPLPNSRVSSPFGTRAHPFTGRPTFHNGTDFAAPRGTSVLAARGGVVTHVGFDAILGNHVVVAHSGGFETVYGHLATAVVTLNQEVASGMILGRVGSTGLTTGSHLHFEIRQHGRHRDPLPLLPGAE